MALEDMSDDALLETYGRTQDMGCIKVLMDRHFDAVRGFVENVLGKKHHAVDDVTQLVWEKIIDGKAEYEKDKSFRVWLVGVARNLCFMQLRAEKRRKRHESAGAEEAMRDAPPQHTVPELADSPFVSDAVKKALASLPPEQSKALWMKYVEGKEYEEIAAETGISVGTAKTRVRLAAEKLAKMGFDPS